MIDELVSSGHVLRREKQDRLDQLIDCRYLDLIPRVAEDPEVGSGCFASGVRAGRHGAKWPRLPEHNFEMNEMAALYQQCDSLCHIKEQTRDESSWRRNNASVGEITFVLDDQMTSGQVLMMSESEARRRLPELVVASLGTLRKDKPHGGITARVLFDGTHGMSVNRRTRSAPIA